MKYNICNWTFQRKIFGFPKGLIKSDGFVTISKLLLGCNFTKKRNVQIRIKIDIVKFIYEQIGVKIRSADPIVPAGGVDRRQHAIGKLPRS